MAFVFRMCQMESVFTRPLPIGVQGGEIIEKENICWHENHGELIVEAGEIERHHINLPPNTPKLVAGLRCYVASRYGEAVPEK